MDSTKLSDLVSRLEKCVQVLESRGGGASDTDDISECVEEFSKLVPEVDQFVAASGKLSPDVASLAMKMQELYALQKQILVSASKSKEPPKDVLVKLLKPLCDKVSEMQKVVSKDKMLDNHFKALSEAASCVQWMMATAKAGSVVQAALESSQFYSNRVLKDCKEKPGHKEWVASLNAMIKNLQRYVEDYLPKGLTWNPKGAELKLDVASAPTAVKPVSSNQGSAQASLFASLNAGGSVTSGLKKVDDSQKTHKNPGLRATAVVPEKTVAAASPKVAANVASNKPPVFELSNRKWTIENQGKQTIDVDNCELSHNMYIYNCVGTHINIKGKINSITMDKCKKCSVLLQKGLISTFEVINSSGASIQADDLVPTVSLGGCDDCQIYLAEKSYASEILTSKISAVNIHLLRSDGSDPTEHPLTEQYISRVVDGKVRTEEVKHV